MAGYSCGQAAGPRTDIPVYPPAYGAAYGAAYGVPCQQPPPPPSYAQDLPPKGNPQPAKKPKTRSKCRGKGGKKTFSIISEATGLALDATPGDRLQVWAVNGGDAQKFYEDDEGRVHSALNDWVLQSERAWPWGKGLGSQMLLKPSQHIPQQDWVVWKDQVSNKNNMRDVLEVAVDACNGSPVIWKHADKSRKQRWRVQY